MFIYRNSLEAHAGLPGNPKHEHILQTYSKIDHKQKHKNKWKQSV